MGGEVALTHYNLLGITIFTKRNVMDAPLILQIVEITIATSALIWGFVEYTKRHKIEVILRTITKTYPGDVAKIEQSAGWALENLRNANIQAAKIPDCDSREALFRFINLGSSDAGGSAKMCVALFNQLLAFQEAQFGTRDISHPHADVLALCIAEARNAQIRKEAKANSDEQA